MSSWLDEVYFYKKSVYLTMFEETLNSVLIANRH